MEDDTETRGEAGGGTPDSLLPYDQWMEDALRHVVARALTHAIEEGLPGGHHFYITFRTDFPGVVLPPRLLQKYPEEMTIVLQHQYENLHRRPSGRAVRRQPVVWRSSVRADRALRRHYRLCRSARAVRPALQGRGTRFHETLAGAGAEGSCRRAETRDEGGRRCSRGRCDAAGGQPRCVQEAEGLGVAPRGGASDGGAPDGGLASRPHAFRQCRQPGPHRRCRNAAWIPCCTAALRLICSRRAIRQ